jgi:hypothetical protein
MMIGKRTVARHLPACIFQVPVETLWPRDAGEGKRRAIWSGPRQAPSEGESRWHELAQRFRGVVQALRRVAPGFSPAGGLHHQRVGCGSRIKRLAKPARGKRAHVVQRLGHEEKIDVAHQAEMLEAIIKHMHRASKPRFGKPPGDISARCHEHSGLRYQPGKHEWLVSGMIEVGPYLCPVADDHHAIDGCLPSVASAEDGGALAHVEQHTRDFGGKRGLAAASNREIADADDRGREAPPQMGPALVIPPARTRDSTV